MSEPEDVEAPNAQVVPLAALSVVTQPGAVKILHRSGRVVYTFAGATVRDDVRSLIEQLTAVVGDEKRLRREVELRKPWWRFW